MQAAARLLLAASLALLVAHRYAEALTFRVERSRVQRSINDNIGNDASDNTTTTSSTTTSTTGNNGNDASDNTTTTLSTTTSTTTMTTTRTTTTTKSTPASTTTTTSLTTTVSTSPATMQQYPQPRNSKTINAYRAQQTYRTGGTEQSKNGYVVLPLGKYAQPAAQMQMVTGKSSVSCRCCCTQTIERPVFKKICPRRLATKCNCAQPCSSYASAPWYQAAYQAGHQSAGNSRGCGGSKDADCETPAYPVAPAARPHCALRPRDPSCRSSAYYNTGSNGYIPPKPPATNYAYVNNNNNAYADGGLYPSQQTGADSTSMQTTTMTTTVGALAGLGTDRVQTEQRPSSGSTARAVLPALLVLLLASGLLPSI